MSTADTALGLFLDRPRSASTLDVSTSAPVFREAYSRAEARQAIGIGPTKFWELEKAGLIKVRRIGTKGLVLRSDLMAFLESLPVQDAEQRAA